LQKLCSNKKGSSFSTHSVYTNISDINLTIVLLREVLRYYFVAFTAEICIIQIREVRTWFGLAILDAERNSGVWLDSEEHDDV